MKAVKKILRRRGYSGADDLETGEEITVQVDGYMDLTIEKVGADRVSVAHYRAQMGDLLADPEIVFQTSDSGEWTPIRYTQHPEIHQYNENGLPEVQQFSKEWSQRLEKQGFVQNAVKNGEIQR